MSRRPARFASRLGLAVGGVLAVTIGVMGLTLSNELRRELTDDLSRGLIIQARLGAARAAKGGAGPVVASEISAACGCRTTIIAPDGTLAGDSDLDAAGLVHAENHRLRPEVAAALEGREGTAVRHSATVGKDLLYAAVPLSRAGRIVGAVRLALPLDVVSRRVARTRAFVLWTALAVLAAACAVAWALARMAGRPLEEMAAVARRLAAGDYAARVRGTGGDERGVLGETLNTLAARVERTVGELSAEKSQLSAVLDQMAEGVVAVDGEGRVLLVNPALSRLLGVAAAAARGRRYLESLRHNGIAELLGEVLREGRAAAREVRLFSPDERVFEGHAAPLLRDGRPSGALLVLHDITRQRRLEQVRRDFVANVSHELRTPLAAIKGFAETLREGAMDDKENRIEFLRTIEEHADRLTKMVDDLLDLSAIESGHRAPRLEPTDLAALLAESVRAFAPIAGDRGVVLEVLPLPPLPKALADLDQVRQILANLLDNAIKYTEPGGRVEVSAEASAGDLRVSVRDTGAGIPADDLPRVFERFYRVDKARSREAGGTGLGLSIVKHLVEAHGGKVSVESRQPGGSVFRFTLRAA